MTPSAQKINFCRVMGEMARRWKDNLAIVNVERNRRYTFAEYHRLTNRIANMCRDRLRLRRGDTAMAILDNDNFSLVHSPAIFKQEAAFLFSNLRDGPEENLRPISRSHWRTPPRSPPGSCNTRGSSLARGSRSRR